MSNRQLQQHNQYGYVFHRPISPKISQNNQTSPTNNNNKMHTNFLDGSRHPFQNHQLNAIHKQNQCLKEENQYLRRQLSMIRKEGNNNKTNYNFQNTKQINDLRETIKKQTGQIKELKVRLQVLSNQSKINDQIIDNMQGKINKLTINNKFLQEKNKKLLENKQKQSKLEKIQNQKLQLLKDRVNEIMLKYKQLQSIVYNYQIQQNTYKQQWNRQKTYYLNRIKDLQILMGIGSQIKDYDRKRY